MRNLQIKMDKNCLSLNQTKRRLDLHIQNNILLSHFDVDFILIRSGRKCGRKK